MVLAYRGATPFLLLCARVTAESNGMQCLTGVRARGSKVQDRKGTERQLSWFAAVSVPHCPRFRTGRLDNKVEAGQQPVGDLEPSFDVWLQTLDRRNGEGFGHIALSPMGYH